MPPCLAACEGYPAFRGVLSMDEWWQGDPRAARRCIFGDSGTPAWSGGLLYRLVEGADGSSAPRRDPLP